MLDKPPAPDSRRATTVGLVLGVAVGLALSLENVTANPVLAIATWIACAIVGFRLGGMVEQELVRRKDVREGRYRRYWATHRGFRRWTWPLSVGAACGFLAFISSDQASGSDFVWLGPVGAGIGVLVAAGVELLAAGPGEGDRRRLGAFLYGNRWHVWLAFAGALLFGLQQVIRTGSPAEAGYGFGWGWSLAYGAWYFGWLVLFPFDGGRDLVPRRWFGSRSTVELVLNEYVVERLPPRNVVRGTLKLQSLGGAEELRVELAVRKSGKLRTPQSGGAPVDFDFREIVDVAATPVASIGGASLLSFRLVIPESSAPTLTSPTLSVDWSVRAVAVTPRKLDATVDARLVVVPPRADIQPSAAPVRLPGAATQGQVLNGEFLPVGHAVAATTPFNAPTTSSQPRPRTPSVDSPALGPSP